MAYRKLAADKIFTGTSLLSDHVLVVASTGSVIDLIHYNEAGADVELFEGWLCPGFVNAHCHIELSHMAGKAPRGVGMTDFLLTVLLQRQSPAADKLQAMQEAITQMLHHGIVAVGDICNTNDSLQPKLAQQSISYQNFIELSGFVPASANARLDAALQVSGQFRQHFPEGQVHITPHAAYSVSEKLYHLIAQQAPAIISVHNQESKAEEDFIKSRSGELLRLYEAIGVNIDHFEAKTMSSLQYSLPMLPASAQWILVHNCYTSPADIVFLKEQLTHHIHACFFCLCPNANLYIGNPLPDVQALHDSGIPICLGTDSLTNNEQLSILAEIQTLQKQSNQIPIETMLQWATWNGARALQIESQFGSFDKGKQPGVLLLQDIAIGKQPADWQVLRLL